MIYKCKNCGSALRYDIATGKMVCDYCNSVFETDEVGDSVLRETGADETMETKVYVCSACGAELMINDVETATFCAYCGQPTIVFDRISKVRKPEAILPFKITKEDACARIRERLKKGAFVPDRIKTIEPSVVRGIFVPFTLSDIHYEEHCLVKGKVHEGSSTYNRHFYRYATAEFRGLPVDASIKFNDESAARLAPFPSNELQEFEASYLSGFYADTGDEAKRDIDIKIRDKAKAAFSEEVLKSVKASKKEIIERKPHYEVVRSRYVFLPVWFFACNDEDFRCTIIVNGYTGKVVGAVPIDKVKVTVMSVIIGVPLVLAIACLCGAIVGALFGGNSSIDFDSDILEPIGAGLVALVGSIGARFRSFRKSLKLSKEQDIFDFAKNRQEESK